MRRLTGVMMIVASVAATVVASGAIALADRENQPIRELQDYSTPPEQKRKLAQEGSSHKTLGVFRRGRRSTDDLLGGARLAIEQRTNIAENPELARRAVHLPSGYAKFLVPADGDLVGVYDNNGSGGVTTVSQIISGESYGLDICAAHLAPDFVRFHGELPDDAEQVLLVRRDGSTIAPVVGENAWAIEVAVTPRENLPEVLRFLSGGERREVALSIPPDLTEGRCVDPKTARERIAESKRLRAAK